MPTSDASQATYARFHTTQWTVVLAAGDTQTSESRDALGALCQAYWKPLYAFARREGHDSHGAKDLVQGFFLTLIDRRSYANAAPEQGRFRSFLIAGLKNYAITEWRRAGRQKREGSLEIVSIDEAVAEAAFESSLSASFSPEKAFERQWALAVIEHALAALRAQFERRGKHDIFEAFVPVLNGEDSEESYAQIGRRLDLTTGALKSMAVRLRQAFRNELRREIARTVANPLAIDDEFAHLQAALR